MHQYLDSDGSGTSATCVSSSIGASRLADATSWLQAKQHQRIPWRDGGWQQHRLHQAVQGALCSMQQAGGVWIRRLVVGCWTMVGNRKSLQKH